MLVISELKRKWNAEEILVEHVFQSSSVWFWNSKCFEVSEIPGNLPERITMKFWVVIANKTGKKEVLVFADNPEKAGKKAISNQIDRVLGGWKILSVREGKK